MSLSVPSRSIRFLDEEDVADGKNSATALDNNHAGDSLPSAGSQNEAATIENTNTVPMMAADIEGCAERFENRVKISENEEDKAREKALSMMEEMEVLNRELQASQVRHKSSRNNPD